MPTATAARDSTGTNSRWPPELVPWPPGSWYQRAPVEPVTASGVPINTNQAGTVGDDASPPNPVTLRIAGRDVAVVSAIYSTDNIGVYAVTFDLPADAPSGADADFGVSTTVGDQNPSVAPFGLRGSE